MSGPVERAGIRRFDQVVPELVTREDLGPADPAAPLSRTAIIGAIFLGVARLIDEVSRHGDRVVNAADVAIAGAEPLVVVGIVVDLERHDPIAEHVGVVDAGGCLLLIGGVGVALQAGVGMAGHVPGVGDARRGGAESAADFSARIGLTPSQRWMR